MFKLGLWRQLKPLGMQLEGDCSARRAPPSKEKRLIGDTSQAAAGQTDGRSRPSSIQVQHALHCDNSRQDTSLYLTGVAMRCTRK
jgi:hypothetical protein